MEVTGRLAEEAVDRTSILGIHSGLYGRVGGKKRSFILGEIIWDNLAQKEELGKERQANQGSRFNILQHILEEEG